MVGKHVSFSEAYRMCVGWVMSDLYSLEYFVPLEYIMPASLVFITGCGMEEYILSASKFKVGRILWGFA